MSSTMQSSRRHIYTVAILAINLLWQLSSHASEAPVVIPAPILDELKTTTGLQTAVLAGGCFWGIQGVFEHVQGVKKVLSGYAGGDKGSAHYDAVSSGTSGHAEAVQITFDPKEVSYGKLLHIFFRLPMIQPN
jgi:peptide-methionine (S)-S-oxide reductase